VGETQGKASRLSQSILWTKRKRENMMMMKKKKKKKKKVKMKKNDMLEAENAASQRCQ
jgi:hypothetical protein